ncbi:MAG: GxxExxY protein [Proteobacteria bacterium]|jgi:GxxExxY protein|nr:GxxExxY protein [Pseudomonadota bacterium]NDF00556.1 GxxExxY protein [Verrucomicrobiota bacterium]
MLEHEELTGKIIGAAIRVHTELGPGFIESIYEEALALELQAAGIPFERQKVIRVLYRGQQVGEHRLDLLMDKRVVVELKAVSELENIFFARTRSYLKALDLKHGLLLNFAAMPLTIKRVHRELSHGQ